MLSQTVRIDCVYIYINVEGNPQGQLTQNIDVARLSVYVGFL